jgi:hypothetical protein
VIGCLSQPLKIYSRRGKISWSPKIKYILDITGLSFVWNEGIGPKDINTNREYGIKIVRENQKMSEDIKKKTETLMFYKDVKVVYQ